MMLDALIRINEIINGFVWGPIMLAAFLGVGLIFSVKTRWFQLTHSKLWLKETLVSIFEKRNNGDQTHSISQFQALTTALAGTVGTGNIAGVASAIALGGPGAVFWMWLSAGLGMMTSFAEKTLGIKYRYKDTDGRWVGGAMVYIERGIGCKWLAVAFSCFCVLASFGMGNMAQINSISSVLYDSFGIKPLVSGVLGAFLIGMVIVGGIQRIARVTEKLVPFMVITYMIGCVICILAHIERVPGAFGSIFAEAFKPAPMAGGVLGYGIARAMRMGVSRGVFSNEAGIGSSVMAHAAADVKEPAEQGMWGIFEVFADTLVVCTLTALVILTSGVYDMGDYAGKLHAGEQMTHGAVLTANAMAETYGAFGKYFVAIGLTLFAFSTIISWSYYGERGAEYAFGQRAVPVYKVLCIAMVLVGSVSRLSLVWGISDTFNGLMAIPNLIAIALMSGEVVQALQAYLKKRRMD